MPLDAGNPFLPQPPARYEIGRLVTHRVLEAGWQCRCCPNLLTATAGGGVICMQCDTLIGASFG